MPEKSKNYGIHFINLSVSYADIPVTWTDRHKITPGSCRMHRNCFVKHNHFIGLYHRHPIFLFPRVNGVFAKIVPIRFEWLKFTDSLQIDLGILLDPISVMMLVVITTVSLMVHIYSLGYMKGERGFQRYYAFCLCSHSQCWDWSLLPIFSKCISFGNW